ncbi:DUF6093 family protein [Micromonospora humida]|uniref:DUF6093 family protein n=1 Tax=Micromonospora humida TaxID=2809018 RepID=UPI003670A062
MSVESALRAGRRAAERLMVDQCTIRRRTGETTGPGGVVTPTYATVYEGRCRMQQPTGQAREQEAGEASMLLLRFELQLPMSVAGVQADDEVLLVTSVHDPDLAGRDFLVRGLSHKTHAVMRRLQLEEVTS